MASTNAKFMMLGKSKYVHVVRTKTQDLRQGEKGSGCQQVRKYQVAGNIPKGKGLSVEAASALEPCPLCHTAEAIAAATPPEVKREAAKAKARETMDKIADESKTKAQKKKGKGKGAIDGIKRTKRAAGTKGGGRSAGGSNQEKADGLAAFAKEHGWKATVEDADPGLVVVSIRGEETIRCWFVDGKYDTVRHAVLEVGTWSGKLRGVHGCRKQMAGEGRDRPHPQPGKGRSGPRKGSKGKGEQPEDVIPEDESPEDAKRRVPFSMDDDAIAIIDAIKGKTIRWRNGVSKTVEEAWLPDKAKGKKRDLITIIDHPKTGKRMVNFLTVTSITEHGPQYGPERTVYLDRIVRVVG